MENGIGHYGDRTVVLLALHSVSLHVDRQTTELQAAKNSTNGNMPGSRTTGDIVSLTGRMPVEDEKDLGCS